MPNDTLDSIPFDDVTLLDLTNDFLRGYLGAALWTGTDESDEPLDGSFSISDFALEDAQRAAEECQAFQQANAADLESFYEVWPKSPDGNSKESFAGHNFWLNRCGHGTGFWDRDAGEPGERLSEASRKAGERYVYIGDDGQLHLT